MRSRNQVVEASAITVLRYAVIVYSTVQYSMIHGLETIEQAPWVVLFVELHFEVKNKSDAIVENLQYRLAANIDDKQLSQHILCVGGHMHGYISQLLPNESQTVSIGICFLTKGSFLLDYLITPSRSPLSQTNEEDTSKADEAVSITSFLTANAKYSYKSIKVHVH